MRSVKINLYQFDELNEETKKKVLEKFRYINVEWDWYEPVYEGFKEIVSEYGIEIDDMNFSGFYSQGDGASFTGEISDFKKFAEKTGLEKLARFSKVIEENLVMKIKRYSSNYYHSGSVYADVYGSYVSHPAIENPIEGKLREVKEELCEKLYRILEEEYDYLTSDEVVKETIIANGYEFTEGGELF